MRTYAEWGAQKVIIDKIEPTHYVRNYLVFKLIRKYSEKYNLKNVCEIGCGTGSLSIKMADFGLRVDASDLDKNAIALAKKFNNHKNVAYNTKNVLYLKNNRKYDLVVTIEVLEHIEKDSEALIRIKNVTKDKGFLLITVPIHEKYRRNFDNRSGHIKRYEPEELIKKIKKAGFKIIQTRYFNFPFLWLWYFYVYLPYSDKKEKQMIDSKSLKKELPKWIWLINIINKFFLIDLLFNSKKYSTDMLVIARKP